MVLQENKVYTSCKSDARPQAGTSLMQNHIIWHFCKNQGTETLRRHVDMRLCADISCSRSAGKLFFRWWHLYFKLSREVRTIYEVPNWNLSQGDGGKF